MTVFARAHHGPLYCYDMNPVCSAILYQRIDLQIGPFAFSFTTKILYASLVWRVLLYVREFFILRPVPMFGIEPGIFWILRKLSCDQRHGRVIRKSCFVPDRQPFGHEVIWCDSQSLAHEVVLRSRTPYVLRLGSNGAAGIFISPNKNGCRYSTEARGNPCAYPEMSPSVLLTAVRNCFPCAPSAKNNIVNSETSEMKPAS